jgi:hypothetical protein
MLKFEASGKLREMQARQQELRQKCRLYRQHLDESQKRVAALAAFAEAARARADASQRRVSLQRVSFERERSERSQLLEERLVWQVV